MKTRLVVVGAVALLAQVALLRELSVAFYGSELIVVLALGVWLLGTGSGALLPYRKKASDSTNAAEGSAGGEPRLQILFLLAAILLPLLLVLVRDLHRILGGVPGAYLQLPRQLLGLLGVLLPMGLVMGRLFRVAADAYIQRGGSAARAYAYESAGSLVGGVLATVLLFFGLSNFFALLLTALLAAAAALLPGIFAARHVSSKALRLASAVGTKAGSVEGTHRISSMAVWLLLSLSFAWSVILLAALPQTPRLDRVLSRWNHPFLVATRDTPYGRLTLDGRGGQIAVFVNNALSYESQGTAAEEFAQLAALQLDQADSILVLGGGAEGLVAQLLQFQPRRIDLVELDARAFRLESRLLPAASTDALRSGRVRVIFGDPRRELQKLGSYDLIVLGMPQPESGQANRFYTKEFFLSCRRHLSADGVLALRLRAAENLWTPLLTWRNASVVNALRSVFPQINVLPGTVSVVVAASQLSQSADLPAKRFVRRDLSARRMSSAYIHYLYENDRRQEIAQLLAGCQAPVNTDRRPVGYISSLLLWFARFHPSLSLHEVGSHRVRNGVIVSVLLAIGFPLLLLLRSAAPLARSVALAAVAGLSAMVLEGVVVLAYQTSRGVLYQDLGLLLSLFMLGLAVGAMIWGGRRQRRADEPSSWDRRFLLLSVSGLSLFTAALVQWGAISSLAWSTVVLVAAGAVTGALFAEAARGSREEMRRKMGKLYAADLAGGCVGAVLTSLILAPFLGLVLTAVVIAILTLGLAASLRG